MEPCKISIPPDMERNFKKCLKYCKTMDETVKTKLEKIADNATRSITQSPGNTQTIVNDEAAKLTAQTEIKISSAIMEKANQSGRQLEQKLANLEAAKVEIDTRVRQAENSRTERLIAQLHSPDKSVRETAAQRLSQIGDRLSQTRVNEIIGIMRHGNESWQTSGTRNEGRHCTDYEYTSIKYYAATALVDMNSRYVSSDIAREARKSQSDSVTTKRVTDPGWI